MVGVLQTRFIRRCRNRRWPVALLFWRQKEPRFRVGKKPIQGVSQSHALFLRHHDRGSIQACLWLGPKREKAHGLAVLRARVNATAAFERQDLNGMGIDYRHGDSPLIRGKARRPIACHDVPRGQAPISSDAAQLFFQSVFRLAKLFGGPSHALQQALTLDATQGGLCFFQHESMASVSPCIWAICWDSCSSSSTSGRQHCGP